MCDCDEPRGEFLAALQDDLWDARESAADPPLWRVMLRGCRVAGAMLLFAAVITYAYSTFYLVFAAVLFIGFDVDFTMLMVAWPILVGVWGILYISGTADVAEERNRSVGAAVERVISRISDDPAVRALRARQFRAARARKFER